MTCHLSLVIKRGSSFGYESSHVLKGRVSIEDFCFVRVSGYISERCSEDFCMFFFSLSFRYIVLVHWSCDHLVISPCIVSFLSLYTYFLFYCMQSFISVSH